MKLCLSLAHENMDDLPLSAELYNNLIGGPSSSEEIQGKPQHQRRSKGGWRNLPLEKLETYVLSLTQSSVSKCASRLVRRWVGKV